MIGRQVGSYCILEKLGQGGMGEVYKAEDTRLKRLVAIKVLRRDKVGSEQGRLRFLQEARAASALNHRNIVQIYELHSQDGAVDAGYLAHRAGRMPKRLYASASSPMAGVVR